MNKNETTKRSQKKVPFFMFTLPLAYRDPWLTYKFFGQAHKTRLILKPMSFSLKVWKRRFRVSVTINRLYYGKQR